ncbi:MAG: FAD-binding protein, partial [Muribaculaceae bacterium]|nr:FAD-binding protein [Muribaculaceae bacterium]
GIARRLQRGFEDFDRKQKGFATADATVIGCETRTSAPVRIPRDSETLCHVDLNGLYPAGEGAGYAGGIVSAAIDGDRVAAALAARLRVCQ